MEQQNPETQATALIDVLSISGQIVAVDPVQAARLGYAPEDLEQSGWETIYPLDSRERIEGLFAQGTAVPMVVPLQLRCRNGALLSVTGVVEPTGDTEHGSCLRLYKWPQGGALDDVARLAEENEVLSGILAASDDAGWCMEWTEPVDLSAPEQEVIRQVFENRPRWRFCNAAMARLYDAPEGQDFNQLPVHETFPRSPENEDFIRRLVRSNFDVNGCPSRDLRYDGVYLEVENDVRGHIRGNRLFRMWGTVRDVSKHMRRLSMVQREITELQTLLAALPDPLVVIDDSGAVHMTNTAAEDFFGASSELLDSRSITELFRLPCPVEDMFAAVRDAKVGPCLITLPLARPGDGGAAQVVAAQSLLEAKGADLLLLSLRTGTDGGRCA